MLKFKFLLLYFFTLSIFSCQPLEMLDKVAFDYKLFPTIEITAKEINIIELYESKYAEPYIDYSLNNTPNEYLIKWFKDNIKIIGAQNKLIINILDASLKKTEILNEKGKQYSEQSIFLFELNFLVEYILLDDSEFLIAKTTVEANRTTTSGKFISIMELNSIIDNLILESLKDFSNKSEELIQIYMRNFVL
tara:strand:+ start:527 stop:1102 length:576 start_codon:yes stop_codon:yes gene_type:complete